MKGGVAVSDVLIRAEDPRGVVVRITVHKSFRQLGQLVHLALVSLNLAKEGLP